MLQSALMQARCNKKNKNKFRHMHYYHTIANSS